MSKLKEPKVFCIGFHKTGTSSMRSALLQLGYSVTGPNGKDLPDIGERTDEVIERLVPQYDAFQDNPWPLLYRTLDERFPGSKFILTLRDREKWLRSLVDHFGTRDTPMREWIYGVGHPVGNEDIYRERYDRHNREVQEFFADRPDDLLVMELAAGHGWERLCPFLGCEQPDTPFPHANAKGNRAQGTVRTKARRLVKRLLNKI